jgi:hypothetical protein
MRVPAPFSSRSGRAAILLAAAFAVSSCGGGDPWTGLWEGTVDGNRPASAIVLGDGTYFLKYAGANGTLGGLVRGTADFHGATLTTSDSVDFHFAFPPQRPTPAQVNGKVAAKGGSLGVTGALNDTSMRLAFVRAFDPDGKLADLAGSYPGEVTFSLGLRQTTFEVTSDGALTTTLNGCAITGQVTPRRDEAFDLTIRFGGLPCVFPGAVFQGAAIYSHDLQQLDAAVVNPSYGQAITFIARKNR